MGETANAGRRWVVTAAVLLVSVRLALPVARLDTVRRFAAILARVGTVGAPTVHPEDIGSLVASVAYRIPDTKCLASSVTASALIEAQGHDADLKIGVRKWNGDFYAHAWVESDGRTVVGGHVDTGSYAELVDYEQFRDSAAR